MSFAVTGSIVNGLIGADATKDAADTQAGAADRATQLQREQFEQTRADNAGYRARGNSAADRLALLLGLDVPGYEGGAATDKTNPLYGSLTKQFTGADLASEPGYQFGLKQGNDAIERSASARGGLYSGATLKALQRYGQDYGGTKFDAAFNRDQIAKNSLYNQLAGVSGTGQLATNQVSQAGENFAANAGANLIGAGNAQAANQIARGNILTGAINQGASSWQRARTGGSNGGAWDVGGYSGSNDPSWASGGYGNNGLDWWGKYGSGGD